MTTRTVVQEPVGEQLTLDLEYDDDEPEHVGHYSHLGGTYWCDTCDSPYCVLA